MSAVKFIDVSALETLETLVVRLRDAGVTLHLAEVKGPVMDKLKRVDFEKTLGAGKIYLSTHKAMTELQTLQAVESAELAEKTHASISLQPQDKQLQENKEALSVIS